jgi:hypothetical protein
MTERGFGMDQDHVWPFGRHVPDPREPPSSRAGPSPVASAVRGARASARVTLLLRFDTGPPDEHEVWVNHGAAPAVHVADMSDSPQEVRLMPASHVRRQRFLCGYACDALNRRTFRY